MGKGQRIYQIDLFRFIAALWVVFHHYTFRGHNADDLSIVKFPFLGEYFKYGYLGVDLFFIISGFVIVLSIRDNNLISFVKSRIVRLYPAYWFCLTFTFIVILLYGGNRFSATIGEFLVNITMLNGFFRIKHIDEVYWSLLVELKFYFIIAIYLALIKIKKINLSNLILCWLIISIIYSLLKIMDLESFIILRVFNFFFILNYSFYFIAGMLFYKIYKEGINTVYFVGLFICLILSLFYANDNISSLEVHYGTTFSPIVVTAFVSFFFIIMYLSCTKKLNFMNSPLFLKLSILTYPLYLIHQNIGYIIFNTVDSGMNKYFLLGLLVVAMLVFAYLINLWIEIPLSKAIKLRIEKIITKYT